MVLQNSNTTFSTFLIWDSKDSLPIGEWKTVLWSSFNENCINNTYSIPEIVEEQSDQLKSRYLAWLYELGEKTLGGERLVDHLEVRPGFSYWWMTLLAQKSYGKSSQIYNSLRLIALEDLIVSNQITNIVLVSNKTIVGDAIKQLCANAKIFFEWRKINKNSEPLKKWISRFLPHTVRAVRTLIHLCRVCWQLREQVKGIVYSGQITFVDYLIHLNPKALSEGRFISDYWTDLLVKLDQSNFGVNWIHHYVPYEAVETPHRANDLIAHFNKKAEGQQFHLCLGGVFTITLLLSIIRDYVRITFVNIRLIFFSAMRSHFRPTGSRLDLWPLFKEDWHNSMYGSVAIVNCLFLNLFERALKRLPHQKRGFYLQENQEWEMALVYAWKAAGHGRLVGIQHATVRYWDLRYFFDPRSYERKSKNGLPMPDQVALNGKASIKAYLKADYPKDQILEVEALRYMHLVEQSQQRKYKNKITSDLLIVLVLTDFLPSSTFQQLRWLEQAAQRLPSNLIYIIKPHPACLVKEKEFPSLKMEITKASVGELLVDCDITYTSNITSAAVDAYMAGVPVISVLDGNNLNMSPLRGMRKVTYVKDSKELRDALLDTTKRDKDRDVMKPYFCLDQNLSRWQKLLELDINIT